MLSRGDRRRVMVLAVSRQLHDFWELGWKHQGPEGEVYGVMADADGVGQRELQIRG